MAKIQYPDKLKLAQLPTPITQMKALSKLASRFQDTRIFVKRDDINHGAAAGNKIRKLEFIFADAIKQQAQVVMTCGGVQSNHARATAILARELGLDSVLFLRGDQPDKIQGNLMLDLMVGARVIFVTAEQYAHMPELFQHMTESYAAEKIKAYPIAEGGSNAYGVLGYVAAVEEIGKQLGTSGLPDHFSSIVCATGSGGTYAGLLLGSIAMDWHLDQTPVFTFNICKTAAEFKSRITQLLVGTIQQFKLPYSFMTDDIQVIDGYVGPGYAQATPEMIAFIQEVAQTDGLLLEPVYTGKAMFGLIQELIASPERASRFGRDILFIHTGGLASLFA